MESNFNYEIKEVWVCNECNIPSYTDSISETDIEQLQCPNCGCDEFHKEKKVYINE